jgi:hypothetical protein
MVELAGILNAIAAILWPICFLTIVYIFRKDIRNCVFKNNVRGNDINNEIIELDSTNIINQNEVTNHSEVVNEIPVCKNIKSSKTFIVLDDINDDEILLVTPLRETKTLRKEYFTDYEYKDFNELLKNHLIESEQIDIYTKYINDIEKDADIEAPKPSNGTEPEYVRTYRNMLKNSYSMPSIMLRIIKDYSEIKWVDLVEELTRYGYVGTGGSLGASLRVLYLDGYVDVHGAGDYKSVKYLADRTTGTRD